MSRKVLECYPTQLRKAISQFLPHQGLGLLSEDQRLRWTPRMLVVGAILMAWQASMTLKDRFAQARVTLVQMYPTRRRPGQTYEGFITALADASEQLLEKVCVGLRVAVQQIAGTAWEICGWVVFGCDSSKIDCPMTLANELAFGCGGKKKSGPQQLLTLMFHVGTGVPWSFMQGVACSSERAHLLAMLELLPAGALLLADAGFTGYDLLKTLMDSGRFFVIRVGSNVKLLTKLGYALQEHDGIVYLWPQGKQKKQCEPLALRLIRMVDGHGRSICLLTNVLDPKRLSDQAALKMYRLRWGVELLFRAMKQTLERRKMLSDCPTHAKVELAWSVVGLWLLGLMSVQEIKSAGEDPQRWSPAQALRVVRQACNGTLGAGGCLREHVAGALKDRYQRTKSKKARHWPHKKKEKPPGEPRARMATPQEVLLASMIRVKKIAA
jgi:Transposase DDE domain